MSFRGQTCQTALLLNSRYRKHTNSLRVNIHSIPSQNLDRISVIRFEQRTNSPFYIFFLLVHLPYIYLSILPSIHRFSPCFLRWSKERGLGVTKIVCWAAASVDGFTSPSWLVGLPEFFSMQRLKFQVLFGCFTGKCLLIFYSQQKLYIMWL